MDPDPTAPFGVDMVCFHEIKCAWIYAADVKKQTAFASKKDGVLTSSETL